MALTGCGGAASGTASSAAVSSSAAASGSAAAAGETFKVGIVNYVDHASLNQIVESVESRLDAIGKEKGVTFDYADYYANAQADQSNLNQIGADLVVGAVAALHLHRPPLIVIDMGTATTISAIDAQGRFAGGAIVPGLRLSMESLSGHTSQLPRVSLDAPAKCIGTNTVACMQSGAIYGSAALLDGMIERMEAELGAPAAVIATGGLAGCVTPFCRREIRYEPDLLLIGLAVLWEKNRSGKKA